MCFRMLFFKIIGFFFASRQLFIQPLRHTISNHLEPTRAAQIVFWASFAPKTTVGGAHIEVKLLCQLYRDQIFHYHLPARCQSKENISTCGGRRQAILEMLCDWKPVAWMGLYRIQRKTHPCNGCIRKRLLSRVGLKPAFCRGVSKSLSLCGWDLRPRSNGHSLRDPYQFSKEFCDYRENPHQEYK